MEKHISDNSIQYGSLTERGERAPTIRNFPYPYEAALAICSDLDETPDWQIYYEICRFLNTTEETAMGPGVGLEVGNSIFFYMPPEQFSYWNADETTRAKIRSLIQSGHIDCLHSFGDLATTRGHAGQSLDELARHNCRMEVWVDHGVAPTNFGADIMRGRGDIPGSEAYHADLTCDYGIRYVWRGRITSVIGQDAPPMVNGIFNPKHPGASLKTELKEKSKRILACMGNRKYAMHRDNALVRHTTLRSGQRVIEFIRSNPHWGGISFIDTAEGLGDILRPTFLERLIDRKTFIILYTHLGKKVSQSNLFSPKVIEGLKTLAHYAKAGKILVTTTKKLLVYHEMVRKVKVNAMPERDIITMDLQWDGSLKALDGLTIFASDPEKVRLSLNGRGIDSFKVNGSGATGVRSLSIPWGRLEFPRF